MAVLVPKGLLLSLWNYPNRFPTEEIEKGMGKELFNLLFNSRNDVLLFSYKS